MADDPGKESLDNNTNDQPDPSEEIIPSEDTQPIRAIEQTENMEVHHHTHPGHHKKKWTDFFWEFLMLFLAVFCGFFAEYQLEHKIERDREEQYMVSMIKDLQSDTASLNEGFPRKDARIMAIDSLFDYFSVHPGTNTIPGYVYRLLTRANFDRTYDRNSVTINQLKNSGGMRLVRRSTVADSLSFYDNLWEKADFWKQSYRQHQEIISNFMGAIINDASLLTYYRNNETRNIAANIPDSLSIRINTTALMPLLNFLYRQKTFTRQDKETYRRICEKATTLILLIKKEYKLK
jgi:hypothetical protein